MAQSDEAFIAGQLARTKQLKMPENAPAPTQSQAKNEAEIQSQIMQQKQRRKEERAEQKKKEKAQTAAVTIMGKRNPAQTATNKAKKSAWQFVSAFPATLIALPYLLIHVLFLQWPFKKIFSRDGFGITVKNSQFSFLIMFAELMLVVLIALLLVLLAYILISILYCILFPGSCAINAFIEISNLIFE